jgi:hypothetical protein
MIIINNDVLQAKLFELFSHKRTGDVPEHLAEYAVGYFRGQQKTLVFLVEGIVQFTGGRIDIPGSGVNGFHPFAVFCCDPNGTGDEGRGFLSGGIPVMVGTEVGYLQSGQFFETPPELGVIGVSQADYGLLKGNPPAIGGKERFEPGHISRNGA